MLKKNIAHVFLALVSFLWIGSVMASDCCNHESQDKVILQLQTESWVTTNTAKVTVGVDSTLDKGNVSQLRSEVMGKLAKIAEGDWHITSFAQTQNVSGLEQVQAIAEVRLQEKGLANLYSAAKSTSRPGLNFKINNVDFSPSLDDMENTRNDLRTKIYNQVNAEIARLHKVNPSYNYVIHRINFLNPQQVVAAAPMNYMARAAYDGAASGSAMLEVSNKLQMQAVVELVPVAILKSV